MEAQELMISPFYFSFHFTAAVLSLESRFGLNEGKNIEINTWIFFFSLSFWVSPVVECGEIEFA